MIQENKNEKNYNLYSDLIKEIQSKIQKDNLYVKFYLFNEENLFNINVREVDPDKLRILSLFKEEVLSFKRKFNTIDEKIKNIDEKIKNIDRKFNSLLEMLSIIFIVLIIFIIFLVFKKTN